MAPHWVKDAAEEHREQGKEWAGRLQADTEKHLPAYPAFCHTLTENFILASGLLPADKGR
jgi:hypothetical protein